MELTKIEQDFINAKKAFVEIFKGYCRDYEIGNGLVTKKFGDFRVVYKSPYVERLAGLKILYKNLILIHSDFYGFGLRGKIVKHKRNISKVIKGAKCN